MTPIWPCKFVAPAGDYYFEDLLKIYEVLRTTGENVRIKTERYEFENFEELRQFNGVIKKIYFFITDPFINVEIYKTVNIYSNNNCPQAQGIIEQLGSLAKDKAEIKRRKLLSKKKLSILVLIMTMLLIMTTNQQYITLGFVVMGIITLHSSTQKSSINLVSKKKKNLITANKRAELVQIVIKRVVH